MLDLNRRAFVASLMASAAHSRFAHGSELDGWVSSQDTFTLSNATILTHTGEKISGGVRVEGGQIAEFGPSVSGGEDLGGAWISPGFTDAGCMVGLVEVSLEADTKDSNEASEAMTPDARVSDAYNALSAVVPVTRAYGIGHVLVHPSSSRLISGQAALFQTAGLTARQAQVLAPAAMCFNLGREGQGEGIQTRMGVAMQLRALFDEIGSPEEAADARRPFWKNSDGLSWADSGDLSVSERALRRVRAGETLALFKAERVDDIELALALIQEHDLRGAILGAAEGHLIARTIADANVPVLLGPTVVQPSSFQHPHAIYENPAILHEAGVKLALRSGGSHFARQLPVYAATAVAHGLPYGAAIAALTSNIGHILQLDGFGQMSVGSPATFFEVDGDPLQPRFPIHRFWINGREASVQTRQTRLYEQFLELDSSAD